MNLTSNKPIRYKQPYDPFGRVADLRYYRVVKNYGVYDYYQQGVLRYCDDNQNSSYYGRATYDNNTGNRTSMKAYDENLDVIRSESYAYDDFQRITEVTYQTDGQPAVNNTFSYDVMGNRADLGAVDGLNRITNNRTYDLLGNTLTNGNTTYTWDKVNRMTALTQNQQTTDYTYRADGLRIKQEDSAGSTDTYYDGQMPIYEVESSGENTRTLKINFLGTRGIESVTTINQEYSNNQWSTTNTSTNYLWYDGHGNVVRTENANYNLSGWQWRGVWGETDSNHGGGGYTDVAGKGYCGSLGHPEDSSGLIYMRARYYEPGMGRFISEDPARQGDNWFLYCLGNPVNYVDESGNKRHLESESLFVVASSSFSMAYIFAKYAGTDPIDSVLLGLSSIILMGIGVTFATMALLGEDILTKTACGVLLATLSKYVFEQMSIALGGAKATRGLSGFADIAIMSAFSYSCICLVAIGTIDIFD